jgi:oligosaccharide repeat unit polymerase
VYMFASIDAVRDSSWTQAFAPVVNQQKVNDYMFGSPAAFANWYAHVDDSDPEWGYRTFSGEFDLLHLKKRVVGKYTGMSNVVGTAVTNIYTLFRDLIEDFTVTGAALICVAIGGLSGWTYRRRSSNVRSALFWLSAFYALILFSPIVSLFAFNGPGLAWVVGYLVLARTRRRTGLMTPLPLALQEAAAP